MFITPLSKEIHESAIINSEAVHVADDGKCLTFWYYMEGLNAGSLLVQMHIYWESLTTVWKISDNQSNVWLRGQAPLISRKQVLSVRTIIEWCLFLMQIDQCDDHCTICP